MSEGVVDDRVDLLTAPVFSTDSGRFSLPGLFAATARGDVTRFHRLRAHQRTAWHMFRVQLAALALRQAGRSDPPTDEAAWRDLLGALTPDHETAWHLLAERAKPAFMQPPEPGGLKWEPIATPDALDMLITARNHDLKAAIAEDATTEDWAYALVSLQTGEGYGGRGPKNLDGTQGGYGSIARMNGGRSSRPFLGLAPAASGSAPDLGGWWRRDVAVLLKTQNEPSELTRGGLALLWCTPWPEGEAIRVDRIDPWAIEVCRRIRLLQRDGNVVAKRAGSSRRRLEAEALRGVMGDAWAPITKAKEKAEALKLGEGRFDYRRIFDLMLSGNWAIPAAAQVQDGEAAGDMVLIAEALSRTKKTHGLKSRTVPIPERARGLFRDERSQLADAAAKQIEDVDGAGRALREATALYALGGDREKLKELKQTSRGRNRIKAIASTACARLEKAADAVFFEHLWGHAASGSDGEAAHERFRRHLVDTARAELSRAFAAIPCPTINAPRARVRARSKLEGLLRHARLVEPKEEGTHG